MRWTRKMHRCGQALVLLAAVLALNGPLFASTLLAPQTNTGLTNVHFKAVRCNEHGLWSFDIVNNALVQAHIEYFLWLEDEDADAIEGDTGQVRLEPKSRETVALIFPCETPFTALRQHFQWAPTGFTRQ